MFLVTVLCFLWIESIMGDGRERIETVELDSSGSTRKKSSDTLQVVFENQSGQKVELWADDDYNVFFKAALDHTESINIDTFIGERCYFTPPGSGGSKERKLYEKIIKKSTKSVILYTRHKMEEIIKKSDLGCGESECKIIFENKTGKTLNVYWDNGKDGVFQGVIQKSSDMTQYTQVGHRFFFTLTTTNDRKDRLHTVTITQDADIVTIN